MFCLSLKLHYEAYFNRVLYLIGYDNRTKCGIYIVRGLIRQIYPELDICDRSVLRAPGH
jgi:hypothetical protein